MRGITNADIRPVDLVFDYEPVLTAALDEVQGEFDERIINQITLWKVQRYPTVPDEVLASLNKVKKADRRIDVPLVRNLLLSLLECRGVQLAMASTYLRFRNPSLFQIIDQRVYRCVYGKALQLPPNNDKNRRQLVAIYFRYLRKLRAAGRALGIPFEQADRILYSADKRVNGDKRLRNY